MGRGRPWLSCRRLRLRLSVIGNIHGEGVPSGHSIGSIWPRVLGEQGMEWDGSVRGLGFWRPCAGLVIALEFRYAGPAGLEVDVGAAEVDDFAFAE